MQPIWLRKYIFDLGKWIWATQPVIAILGGLVTVGVICILSSTCLERQIRLSGMGLQLVGIAVVLVGLWDTRRAFENQPTTWGRIKQWWTGRPRFGPQHRVLQAQAALFGDSVASARVRQGHGPNMPLDGRIALLEQQYASLFDEVGALSAETKKGIDDLTKALGSERSERAAGDKSTKDQLKKAVAEGVPLEVLGSLFFMLGTVAGTASPEIAVLFGRAASCQ